MSTMGFLMNSLWLLTLYPRFLEAQAVEIPGTFFINPAPTSSLPTFQVGQELDVQWTTNLSSFSIFLWAQFDGHSQPNSDSTPLFTQVAGETEQTSFEFKVNKGPFTTTGAIITFFLSIGPDDNISNGESSTSGNFKIVDSGVEDAVALTTSSTISSSTSIQDTSISSSTSITTSDPPPGSFATSTTSQAAVSQTSITSTTISSATVKKESATSQTTSIATPLSEILAISTTLLTLTFAASSLSIPATATSSSISQITASSSSSSSSIDSTSSPEIGLSLGLGLPLIIILFAIIFAKKLKGLGKKHFPALTNFLGGVKIWGVGIIKKGKGEEVFEMSAEKEPVEIAANRVIVEEGR